MSDTTRLIEDLWKENEPGFFAKTLDCLHEQAKLADHEWCFDRAVAENVLYDLRMLGLDTHACLDPNVDPDLTLPPQWSGPLMNETQAPTSPFVLDDDTHIAVLDADFEA